MHENRMLQQRIDENAWEYYNVQRINGHNQLAKK
jgi:hypothetical protein